MQPVAGVGSTQEAATTDSVSSAAQGRTKLAGEQLAGMQQQGDSKKGPPGATAVAANGGVKAHATGGSKAAAANKQKGSSPAGCLYWVTRQSPTNYDMLIFRTLNQQLRTPGHNDDTAAAVLRDHLMPVRSWWLKKLPWAKYQLRSALENPVWGVPGCTNFIDARTKWFDQAVKDATRTGIRQVVVVAAGFDTRAYRLTAPGVAFYEIDLPTASARKQHLVSKLGLVAAGAAPPVYVAADLSETDLATALQGTGFDPSQPALFTVEGLLYYLPRTAAVRLLACICALGAPGSQVYFDFMHSAALSGATTSPDGFKYAGFKVTQKAVANKGEPYLFGLDDSAPGVAGFLQAASAAAAAMVTPNNHHTAAPAGPEAAAGKEGASPAGSLVLMQYLGPRDMVALQLPHEKWNDSKPPIAAFYSYAAARKV